MDDNKFSLAPIQGITDFQFRNLFVSQFEGIDYAYTPFLRLQNDGTIKKSQLKDILPENNEYQGIIPQILVNNAPDFIFLAKMLMDFGYKLINLNMGCPYPMVARKKLGSGLLAHPDRIRELFERVFAVISCGISVKMRTGYESENEIFNVLPVLNDFPFSEIIIHPRIGKQIYKGAANADIIDECRKISSHNITYNGDIDKPETFKYLKNRFSYINGWMIGRAAVSNPFIFEEIKTGTKIPVSKKMERFSEFHHSLFESYDSSLSGPGHILIKMLCFWEYFCLSFTNSKKVYKRIKKAQSINQYHAAIHEILNEEEFVG